MVIRALTESKDPLHVVLFGSSQHWDHPTEHGRQHGHHLRHWEGGGAMTSLTRTVPIIITLTVHKVIHVHLCFVNT